MNEKILKEAWRLRELGCYTMREIADKLGVEREKLIGELEAYLKAQPNSRVNTDKGNARRSRKSNGV